MVDTRAETCHGNEAQLGGRTLVTSSSVGKTLRYATAHAGAGCAAAHAVNTHGGHAMPPVSGAKRCHMNLPPESNQFITLLLQSV